MYIYGEIAGLYMTSTDTEQCPGPRSVRLILAFPKASVRVSSLESHHWLKGITEDSSFRSPRSAYHCRQQPSMLLKMAFFFSLYSCRVWSCLPMPYNFPKLRSHLEAPPHSKLKSFSSSRSSRVDLCLGPALGLVFFPGKQRQGETTRQPRLFARMVFGGDTVKGAEWWAACPAQEAVNLKTAHFLLLSDHVTCLFALSYASFSVNGGLV